MPPRLWGLPGNSDCSRVLRCSWGTLPIHRRGDLDPGFLADLLHTLQDSRRWAAEPPGRGGDAGPTVGPAFAPVHRLTDAGTLEPCACPGRSTPGTHRDMHMHLSMSARACLHAHGRTGIQAWLSAHTHSTCRQLLASTRASVITHKQNSHSPSTHPCLAVCRWKCALYLPLLVPGVSPMQLGAGPKEGAPRPSPVRPYLGLPVSSQSL